MKQWLTDPAKFRKVNGWATIFWIAMIPVSVAAGLISSVEYVSALSIYALVGAHLSTWQATKVEERQEQDSTEQVVHEIKQTQEEEKQTEYLEDIKENGHTK